MNYWLLLLGCLFAAAGVTGLYVRHYQFRNFHKAIGRVIDIAIYATDPDGGDQWRETITFIANNGESYTTTNHLGSYPDSTLGQRRFIFYRPTHPSDAHIYSITHFWLGPAILMLFGLGFILGSGAV